jgi:uncharacterized protein (DUF1697 family)
MDDLVQLFEQIGHSKVETYIQSGNVVFSSKFADERHLETMIETAIKERFGFEVPAMILSETKLERTLKYNPYLERDTIDEDALHATFLRYEADHELVKEFETLDYSPDETIVTNDLVYVYCPSGYGKTKFNTSFIERKLKAQATTRNWKSICALLDLVRKN